jgi:hypothetical protein
VFGSPAGWQAETEMKDRQLCQSEAEARLSVGSAIAVPAITISLKSSLSTAWSHQREEPIADGREFSIYREIESLNTSFK